MDRFAADDRVVNLVDILKVDEDVIYRGWKIVGHRVHKDTFILVEGALQPRGMWRSLRVFLVHSQAGVDPLSRFWHQVANGNFKDQSPYSISLSSLQS